MTCVVGSAPSFKIKLESEFVLDDTAAYAPFPAVGGGCGDDAAVAVAVAVAVSRTICLSGLGLSLFFQFLPLSLLESGSENKSLSIDRGVNVGPARDKKFNGIVVAVVVAAAEDTDRCGDDDDDGDAAMSFVFLLFPVRVMTAATPDPPAAAVCA